MEALASHQNQWNWIVTVSEQSDAEDDDSIKWTKWHNSCSAVKNKKISNYYKFKKK